MPLRDFATEAKWLLRVGGPISVTQLFYSLINPSTLAFCGYLGKDQLDAAALAVSIFQLSVANFASAVRWGLMPFLAQTMAGTKKERVGVYLQRGLVASVILTFFSWTLAMNCGNLLILIGQDPQISADTELYFMILMPGCLAIIVFRALVAYTDTTGHLWPTFVVHVIGLGANCGLHYVLIFHTDLGFVGSAIAMSSTLVLLPIMQAIFIWRLRLHRATWAGWSPRALMGWGKFFKAMLPSIGTQTLWIFGTEVGNFLAGLLGKSEIAAESLLFQLNFIAFLLPVGLGSAVIARIGSHLSLQRPELAKRTFAASIAVMSVTGLVVAGLFVAFRFEIPKLFSLDEESSSMFSYLMLYLAAYTCLQLAGYPCVAALRASNRHSVAMGINFISYYVISLPIGVTLTFAAGWGLEGLWVGFVCASVSFFVLLLLALSRANWSRSSSAVHREAEFETDVEVSARTPLLTVRDSKDNNNDDDDVRKHSAESALLWRAIKDKLPVISGILIVFLLSLILRIALPPQVPKDFPGNVTASYSSSPTTSSSDFSLFTDITAAEI